MEGHEDWTLGVGDTVLCERSGEGLMLRTGIGARIGCEARRRALYLMRSTMKRAAIRWRSSTSCSQSGSPFSASTRSCESKGIYETRNFVARPAADDLRQLRDPSETSARIMSAYCTAPPLFCRRPS